MDGHQAAAEPQLVVYLLKRDIGGLLNEFVEPLHLVAVQRRWAMTARQRSRLTGFSISPQPALKGGDIDAEAAGHLSLGQSGLMGRQSAQTDLLG